MISWDNPWNSAPSVWWKIRTLPLYVIWLLSGFLSGWVQSRRTSALILGSPALIAAFLVISLGVTARSGLNTETIRRYQESAENHARRGEIDQAAFYVGRLKQMGRSSDGVLWVDADIALQRQRPDLAESIFVEMLSNSDKSRDAQAHRQIAILKLSSTAGPHSGRANEAVQHLKTALSSVPEDIAGHELLASVYLRRGELEACAEHLQRVLPSNPAVAYDLAKLYERIGQSSRKIEFASLAASYFAKIMDPKAEPPITDLSIRTRNYLAWTDVLMMLDQMETGTEILTPEVDRHPDPALKQRLALLYILREGQLPRGTAWDKRMELIHLSRHNDPHLEQGLIALANCAAHGPPDLANPALRDLQPYLDQGKAPAAVYFLIGTAAAAKSEWQQADQLLRKAIEIDPRAHVTWNNLAQTLASKTPPDLKEAEKCVNEAIRLNPGPAAYHETRGQILIGQERWAEAVQELELAAQGLPTEVSIHKGLAAAYQNLGDEDLADYHRTRQKALRKPE